MRGSSFPPVYFLTVSMSPSESCGGPAQQWREGTQVVSVPDPLIPEERGLAPRLEHKGNFLNKRRECEDAMYSTPRQKALHALLCLHEACNGKDVAIGTSVLV